MPTEPINDFSQFEKNPEIVDLIQCIENRLPSFVTSNVLRNAIALYDNENRYTEAFCTYMTKIFAPKFIFINQKGQKGTFTIDIGVNNFEDTLIFTIEAKILPTPLSRERNEYEYVYGKGAGIKRFKDGNHGVDNINKPIRENGILAYIESDSYQYWLGKVNQWITEAEWSETEKLETEYFDTIGKLISTHKRNNGDDVILHHFWVNVS